VRHTKEEEEEEEEERTDKHRHRKSRGKAFTSSSGERLFPCFTLLLLRFIF
jgi:hypothetical protein